MMNRVVRCGMGGGRFRLIAVLAMLSVAWPGRSPVLADGRVSPSDFSGMACLESVAGGLARYVVVNDKKDRARASDFGARVGVLAVQEDGSSTFEEVAFGAWPHPPGTPGNKEADTQPNDLEGICAVPDCQGQYLMMETGFFDGDYGRIFLASIEEQDGRYLGVVERVYMLPSDDRFERIQLEGIACFRWKDGLHLLLVDRAEFSNPEDEKTTHSTVFYAQLPDDAEPDDAEQGKQEFPVLDLVEVGKLIAPGFEETLGNTHRHCSELYLRCVDKEPTKFTLWMSANIDPDKSTGPFRSIIYAGGELDLNAQEPEDLLTLDPSCAAWTLDGLKVEALAPAPNWSGGWLSIGTDDEGLGGLWRVLPCP